MPTKKTAQTTTRPKKTKRATLPEGAEETVPHAVPTGTAPGPKRSRATSHRPVELLPIRAPSAQARRWMWLAVGSLSLLIFLAWGWSIKQRFAFFDWQETNEQSFVERNQANWNAIFNREKTVDKAEIKSRINDLIHEFRALSPTTTAPLPGAKWTSSTIFMATSTTTTNTPKR